MIKGPNDQIKYISIGQNIKLDVAHEELLSQLTYHYRTKLKKLLAFGIHECQASS